MDKPNIKEYTNGAVTVVWKPGLCIHAGSCVRGLPAVFNHTHRPWINAQGADTDKIVNQVKKCPSGALSYYMNDSADTATVQVAEKRIVEVLPSGPLMVYGNIQVKHADGSSTQQNKVTAFCRCGASANKPYCDGTHNKIGFVG